MGDTVLISNYKQSLVRWISKHFFVNACQFSVNILSLSSVSKTRFSNFVAFAQLYRRITSPSRLIACLRKWRDKQGKILSGSVVVVTELMNESPKIRHCVKQSLNFQTLDFSFWSSSCRVNRSTYSFLKVKKVLSSVLRGLSLLVLLKHFNVF